ncbi:MAG: DNA polymerase I, partial [Gammaproteobacteria bacterium]|nr:DNA polymerase I [Gammaproteobacteria bacterium]
MSKSEKIPENQSETPPIILVDGSSYLYRAYHVPQLQRLTNGKGEMTGAVYGVINMLRKLRTDYQPEYMAVVFDAKGKTFRHEMYPEYKGTRPTMPDDLRNQIEPLHELVRAMGFKLISEPGVEADDVIGTLATQASAEGKHLLVSTGDKDMAQLVSPHVTLINTMSNTLLDEVGVEEKFGVRPDQIVDYLALVGDTSDNIPGVPKVGAKTAAKWLKEYDTLDNLIAHADEIKGKVGEYLRDALEEQLPLSRRLTEISCDLKLAEALDDLKVGEPDTETLRRIYPEWQFRNWLDELSGDAGEKQARVAPEVDYETVLDQETFERWLEKLNSAELIAFDTETTSLDYLRARIVGVSFAVEEGSAAYVPFGHDYPGAPEQLDEATVLGALKPILEDSNRAKLGQNLKYDAHVLQNHGIKMQGIAEDTML